jgi:AraC-like DNA-binding protein
MRKELPLLHGWRVFASRNVDQTLAFMTAKEFRLDLGRRAAGDFDFIANCAYMPGSYLGYIQYGADATIHVPEGRVRDDYWVHFPARGCAEISNSAGTALCSPEQAVFSSPSGHRTRSTAGAARFTLSITRATMLARLATLLGDAPGGALDFAPEMSLESRPGRRLMRHLQLALEELDEPEQRSAAFLGMYEELIVTAMLLSQPHTFSDRINRLARPTQPRSVQLALDYIESHLDGPVTLGDLVVASGVPGRTLLQHFRDHHGVSPVRYWRDRRFARVHEALLRARANTSVTEIAMAWGFYHLGRFAMEYTRRFGESPSETRRRGGQPGHLC